MFVRSITISRENDWGHGPIDASKPMLAKIKVQNIHGEIVLALSPEVSQRVLGLIAEEVAAAGRATAEAMTAEILTHAALPAPEPHPF